MENSLGARFRELEEERNRTWPASQLAANRAQRSALLAAFDPAATVQIGDRLEDAQLLDSRGGAIRLDGVVAGGPAVLIFFRYASCPADNLALPHYDRFLFDALLARGVPLLAISPQVPGKLDAIRVSHGLRLAVASDPDNHLARRLGLVFTPLETPDPPPEGWVGDVTGTGTWELPQTAALILDAGRIVHFAAISPDWLDRVEPAEILAAVDRLLARGETVRRPAPVGA